MSDALTITLLGWIFTLVVVWVILRSVYLDLCRRRSFLESLRRRRLWFTPIAIGVAIFWLAPWPYSVGVLEARRLIQNRNIINISLPREVWELPGWKASYTQAYRQRLKDEMNIRLRPPSSIIFSVEHEDAYRTTMAKEVERRFGEKALVELAQRVIEEAQAEEQP